MKIITAPIKNATLFSANIYNKEEIMIIIKDTIPGNKLIIEVDKTDIFILRSLATK
jgi:hypothetical protein